MSEPAITDVDWVEAVAELQLAAFLAGRGSVTSMIHGTRVSKPPPSMNDFRRMAIAAADLMALARHREAARREALVEAAKVAERTSLLGSITSPGAIIANGIRALIDQTPEQPTP